MTKAQFITNVSRSFHKFGFKLKKHSPEILIAAGVVGTVASAVLACRATLKVNDIADESKKKIDDIHEAKDKGVTKAGEVYSEKDSKKDLTAVYAQTGFKLAKLYAPAVILGAASLGCIITSHNIVRKRNVALAAAYAAVDKSFKEYRGRVVERFGKDLDRELKYNIKTKEVEETVVDENGKEKKVKKTVEVFDVNNCSEFARFFDCGNLGWDDDPEFGLMFLRQQQNYANEKLKAKGMLFLNEVYEMLGIPKTKAGQIAGWVYDEKNPKGDNFVDFGIYDLHNPDARRFVNGQENVILLDFNVDGNVYELLS
jgi:hypothetical protein